jgi:hypothetical protein
VKIRPGPVAAVLLLIVLGAWVYLQEYRGAAQREAAERQRERPLPFARPDVTSIRLENGEGAFRLQRQEELWRLVEPLDTAADKEAVEGILSALEYARIERRIGTEDDLKPYGLESPRATLTLGFDGNDESQTLRIGEHAPIGAHCFALLPGDGGVALVSASLEDLANKSLLSLRDKSLVDLDAWNVRSLRIERGAETVVLTRSETGWKLQSPIEAPADGPLVTDLLNEVDRLQASAFLSEEPAAADLARYGLDRPAARLTVQEEGWESGMTIWFGTTVEEGRAARVGGAGPVVAVTETFWPKVATSLFDLRRKDILALNRHRVRGLTVTRQGGEPLILRHDQEGAWSATGMVEGSAADSSVELLLAHISDLKATAFMDRPSAGQREELARQPALDLTVEEEPASEEGESPAQHLLIGAPDQNGQVKVRDLSWEPIALAPAGVYERILLQLDAIVEEVRSPPAAEKAADDPPDGAASSGDDRADGKPEGESERDGER